MTTVPPLKTDEEEVLTANRAFYLALHSLDIETMARVWLHADWVKCLHPGWELLVGWDEVQGSWEQIFASTEQMMVSVSRSLVHVVGDVAWVSCREDVTSAARNDISSALIEATNIFVRREGRWLLVHHHTTPVVQQRPDAGTSVQ
jgi:ketosteroid isomerase-like protein